MNRTTTIPSEDPRTTEEGKGLWLRFLLSFLLDCFSFARRIDFGVGGPWKANIPVGRAPAFDLVSFFLETCYIHTQENNVS
jgi:hypothetical protein